MLSRTFLKAASQVNFDWVEFIIRKIGGADQVTAMLEKELSFGPDCRKLNVLATKASD